MTKLAEVWQFSTDGCGRSVIRSGRRRGRPRYRVEVVFKPRSARELVAEYASRKEAEDLANWFGRRGSLRATVRRLAS
jgi:hypothetical protein